MTQSTLSALSESSGSVAPERAHDGDPDSFQPASSQLPDSAAEEVGITGGHRPDPAAAAGLSEEERALLGHLKDRKDAAQAVFMALSRAEQAATAAAQVGWGQGLGFKDII